MLRTSLAFALFWLTSASVGHAASQQFDLVCSGSHKSGKTQASLATASPLPIAWRLSIDLDQMLFCQDDCKAVSPIAERDGDRLVLTRLQSPSIRIAQSVDLQSGDYAYRVEFPSLIVDQIGRCRLETFSGKFPATAP